VTTEASEEAKGYVLSQSPKAGEEVEKGTPINVVVSDGTLAKAYVPSLIGLSESGADSALKNAGLKLGKVSYEYNSKYQEGTVMWQQYDSNSQLTKGSKVSVKISKGPEPTTTTAPPTTTTEAPTTAQPEPDPAAPEEPAE
ncbi:MAG: PASTA domain-containing protein, partial [Firmicutes bacterium]|nr:PASTA domain-containing protein [Bacillota bacterium]